MEKVSIKDFTAVLASNIASKAISNKLGVECKTKINEVTLLANENTGTVELYFSGGIAMKTEDLQKLIFQGGKKNA